VVTAAKVGAIPVFVDGRFFPTSGGRNDGWGRWAGKRAEAGSSPDLEGYYMGSEDGADLCAAQRRNPDRALRVPGDVQYCHSQLSGMDMVRVLRRVGDATAVVRLLPKRLLHGDLSLT